MKHLKSVVGILMGFMAYAGPGMAASNPIAWSLLQPFPNPVYTGHLYNITYTFTNKLPLQLVKPLVIEKKASPSSEFTYIDTCTGVRLLPNERCAVQIQLDALIAGEKSVQLSIAGFDDNVVPLPEQVAFANSTLTGAVVGQVTLWLPSSMSANTNAEYSFTFTNNSPIDAILPPDAVTVTQTTGTVNQTNTCTSILHKDGGTCTVQGGFTPTSNTPESQSVVASLSYSGPIGSPVSATNPTQLNTPVPGGPIVGSMVTGDSLPPLMTPGQVVTGVQFLFSNTSTGSYDLTGTPTTVALTWSDDGTTFNDCSGISTPACTAIVNNCIATLGASPAACNITLTFTAPVAAASNPPKTYALKASLDYNSIAHSPATVTTSGTVITTLPTERTIRMVNNCPFALSYSLNGASAPCVPGVTVLDGTGACFWQNYRQGPSNTLAANFDRANVTIPANDIGGIQWSGNISAMTGCDSRGTNCALQQCGNGGVGNCAPGIGFNQPATQAEITMLTNGGDNFDTEVINGFSIPISMKPYYYLDPTGAGNDIPATANNFSCGTPGDYFAGSGKQNGFGACNWRTASLPTTLPAAYFYFVGGGSGSDCSSASCSTSGEVCGLAQTVPNSTITGPVCGNFQGYWTPNQLCTQSTNLPPTVKAGLSCSAPLPPNFNLSTDPYGNTQTSLMACHVGKGYTGPIYNSCYTSSYSTPGTANQCCGCVDWWDPTQTDGAVILANNTAQTCPTGHTNPLWTNDIQANLQWMKKACPSNYVYPFDDTTSKFTCTNGTQSGANSTSYVVTFCPGNSGVPTGKNDGRTNPPIPG